MKKGLTTGGAEEAMIKAGSASVRTISEGENAIIIDAGGTNFRSCLVTFDAAGTPTISEMEKTRMPGVERELSRKEFFEQFAVNLEHLKNKADRIGFCFSYPMEIQEALFIPTAPQAGPAILEIQSQMVQVHSVM